MTKRNRKIIWGIAIAFIMFVGISIVGGLYMLNYSLSPEDNRDDVEAALEHQFEEYPETRAWVDSLRSVEALRDTFVVMPSGERHHAFYIPNDSRRTALVLHGWRDCAANFLYLARLYNKEIGYNVILPDFHAHGQSEGDAIQMGWLDRKDMMHWLSVFQTDTMVVHGVSMGGATTMMMSAEPVPEGVKDLRFIEDCGYSSVWDEFKGELKNQFGLPSFPLLHVASLFCKIRDGWSFKEASALEQVKKSVYPMLFIHGDKDDFVPTRMVYELYEAKPEPKEIWITKDTEHALSYKNHKEEYIRRVQKFCLE